MFQKYKNFVRGVAVNKVGKTGVVLTTTVFITFLIFEFAHTVGLIRNAYVGLITYLAFPLLFIVGLILIPIGWQKYKKQAGKSTRELLFRISSGRSSIFRSRTAWLGTFNMSS